MHYNEERFSRRFVPVFNPPSIGRREGEIGEGQVLLPSRQKVLGEWKNYCLSHFEESCTKTYV